MIGQVETHLLHSSSCRIVGLGGSTYAFLSLLLCCLCRVFIWWECWYMRFRLCWSHDLCGHMISDTWLSHVLDESSLAYSSSLLILLTHLLTHCLLCWLMFLLMLCTVHCCADCALLCTQDVYKGSSLAPSSLRELSPSCDSHFVSPSVTICVLHLWPPFVLLVPLISV